MKSVKGANHDGKKKERIWIEREKQGESVSDKFNRIQAVIE